MMEKKCQGTSKTKMKIRVVEVLNKYKFPSSKEVIHQNIFLHEDHGTVQGQPVQHQQFPGQQRPMMPQVPQQTVLIPPQYYGNIQTVKQTQPLLQHDAPTADFRRMQMFMQSLSMEQQQLLYEATQTTEFSGGSAFRAPSSLSQNQNQGLSQMQTSLHMSQNQTKIQPAPHQQSQDQTLIKEPPDSISRNETKIQEPPKPTSQNQTQIGELPQPVFQNQTRINVPPQPVDQNQSKMQAPPVEPPEPVSEHHLDTLSDDEDEKTVNDTIEVTGLDKTKNNLEFFSFTLKVKDLEEVL
ncbi:uncharacterized protein [Ptychodera flava]|uniref:uncharacterized protein n=1 Tax=Ptychodera flava TaxID=63121 RepID=UPI00396A9D46